MSPKDDAEIRRLILERRAQFVAAALSVSGLNACSTGPSVCLRLGQIGTTATTGTGATVVIPPFPSSARVCLQPPLMTAPGFPSVCLSIAESCELLPTADPFATASASQASATTSVDIDAALPAPDAELPIPDAGDTPDGAGSDAGTLDGSSDAGTLDASTSDAGTSASTDAEVSDAG